MVSFIYVIDDPTAISNKVYVGKTCYPERRFVDHLRDHNLKVKTTKNSWLKSLLSRGTKPRFTILEQVQSDWQEAERFWIKKLKLLDFDITNGTVGGDGLSEPSEAVRNKISRSLKGRKQTHEHIENSHAPLRGRTREFDDKWCSNISEGLYGRKLSDEHRANISKGTQGKNNPFFGRAHSIELNKRNRVAHLGKKLSEEAKAKCREAAKEYWRKKREDQKTS